MDKFIQLSMVAILTATLVLSITSLIGLNDGRVQTVVKQLVVK